MESFALSVETTSGWGDKKKVDMGSYKVRNFFSQNHNKKYSIIVIIAQLSIIVKTDAGQNSRF